MENEYYDARAEARDEARWERRQEYLEDLYEERMSRGAHRCQCSGMDMPGRCPGPDACPLVEHEHEDEDEG